MALYLVSNVSGGRVTLQDRSGKLHLADCLGPAPDHGAELHGIRPNLGFAVLSAASTGRMHPVAFVGINCSATDLADRHPAQSVSPLPATAR